jgi:hypothetical protein
MVRERRQSVTCRWEMQTTVNGVGKISKPKPSLEVNGIG